MVATTYLPAVERLFDKGEGVALYYATLLAELLPDDQCQRLLLHRLTTGPLVRGCRHLYMHLKPPFDAKHEDAAFRGLAGADPTVAVAAAKVAVQLKASPSLVERILEFFEEWRTKEEPYPTTSGAVPESPRDEMAKILARELSSNISFLVNMAEDTRPNVRRAATEPLTTALTASEEIQDLLLGKIAAGKIDGMFLHQAISMGAITNDGALQVVSLLKSVNPKVRFGALPILSPKYLPAELVRIEAKRLLTDPEIEIREGAYKALAALQSRTT